MDTTFLKERIRQVEGFRSALYPDQGGWAIGYGRNLTRDPLDREEAEFLLECGLRKRIAAIGRRFGPFEQLDPVRREVLVEVAYNCGVDGLFGFQKMLKAVAAGDWVVASAELLDSEAARRLPGRYRVLAGMLLTGERV